MKHHKQSVLTLSVLALSINTVLAEANNMLVKDNEVMLSEEYQNIYNDNKAHTLSNGSVNLKEKGGGIQVIGNTTLTINNYEIKGDGTEDSNNSFLDAEGVLPNLPAKVILNNVTITDTYFSLFSSFGGIIEANDLKIQGSAGGSIWLKKKSKMDVNGGFISTDKFRLMVEDGSRFSGKNLKIVNEKSDSLIFSVIGGGVLELSDSEIIQGSKGISIGNIDGINTEIAFTNTSLTGGSNFIIPTTGLSDAFIDHQTRIDSYFRLKNSKLYASTSKKTHLIHNDYGRFFLSADSSEIAGNTTEAPYASYHASTNLSLVNNSIWSYAAGSTLTNLHNETGSHIYFGNKQGAELNAGNIYVNGNYVGNNSTLHFTTVLGDDNSDTNQLIVSGNTSGHTYVSVTNAGGKGAQTVNGIKLIEVKGQSDGVFEQQGRIVAGAYDYRLSKKGKDWYLNSQLSVLPQPVPPQPQPQPVPPQPQPQPVPPQPQPELQPNEHMVRPEVGGYLANSIAAANMFNLNLFDRLASARYLGETSLGLWLKNTGEHISFKDALNASETSMNLYTVQLGDDFLKGQFGANDSFVVGAFGGYGYSKSKTTARLTGYQAKAKTNAYNLGLYGTWFANANQQQGTYLDTWVQYAWFKQSVNGQDLAAEKYHTSGVSASLELGHIFRTGEKIQANGDKLSFFFQPQAQVIYMGVKGKDYTESNDTIVKTNRSGNVQSRIGARMGFNTISVETGRNLTPYFDANWIHNTQANAIELDGMHIAQAGAKNLAQLKLGLDGNITRNLSLGVSVSVEFNGHGAHEYKGTKGTFIFGYKF